METRVEHDSIGPVEVPGDALWGASTQRAIANFPLSGRPVDPALIHALGAVKASCAAVNGRLGVLPHDVSAALVAAAQEVAAGRHDAQFPVDVFQTGSGTSTNMNANEVLATLAGRALGRRVHPNDEANASQSSNDVFPTAAHAAATGLLLHELVPALEHLAAALEERAGAFADVVKPGRTHLMDATPVTLGQELGGYAAQCRRGVERLLAAVPRLAEVPLGGTAVGTGVTTPPGWRQLVVADLAARTGLPLVVARDAFEAQSVRDALVETSGATRTVAVSLLKVCDDLRWMGSGPAAGLAELRLPSLQPGSSIMPGKVNPVVPEAVAQVCLQVLGHDATVTAAGSRGSFELTVTMPVMAQCLLDALRLLAAAARLLADRCVAGLEADVARAAALAGASPAIVTALAPVLGYDAAARVARHALEHGLTIRAAALALGHVPRDLDEPTLDRLLDLRAMTRPAPPAPPVP